MSLVSKKHVFSTPGSNPRVGYKKKNVNDPPLALVLKYVSSYAVKLASARTNDAQSLAEHC